MVYSLDMSTAPPCFHVLTHAFPPARAYGLQHLSRRLLDRGRYLSARLAGRHDDLLRHQPGERRGGRPVPQAAAELARAAACPPDDIAAITAAIHAAEGPGDITGRRLHRVPAQHQDRKSVG